MAKKDISKFQKALLSKTNVMKEEPKKEIPKEEVISHVEKETGFIVDANTLKKYEKLSKKHSIELDELLNYGLKFFLEFEDELFIK